MNIERFQTDALLQSVFKDAYELEDEKLETLYSKSKRHQWNAELDVDWKRFEPDVDVLDRKQDFLSRLECVQELPEDQQTSLFKTASLFTVSQILHGEQAALMVCGQLVNAVPDMDGKFAAAVQVMDEARHVEVFARYLQCHGVRFPIDPDLKLIVEQLLAEHDWEAKCVGMQVILESVALSFFRMGEDMAVEPVFKEFIPRVHEDESRHVAYGVLALEARIPELAPESRERLENWTYDTVTRIAGRAGKPSFASQFQALATSKVDLEAFLPKLIQETSDGRKLDLEGLNDPMAQTVLPNLMRVGLLPDRHVPGYLAQGFKLDLDEQKVTDIHTFHPETKAVRERYRERGLDFSDPAQAGQLGA